MRNQLNVLCKHNPIIELQDMHLSLAAGANREQSWGADLDAADIILLGITPNFTGRPDNDCDPLAFTASQMRKRIVPVLLEDCLWKRIAFLENIVPLPTDEIFVSNAVNKSRALMSVAKGLEELVESIRPTTHKPHTP